MSNDEFPTCTVVVTATTGRCAAPAVFTWTTSRGATYHECAAHLSPGQVAQASPRTEVLGPLHPPTQTTRPFVLVAHGRIVGYAAAVTPAVKARANKLGAAIVPVVR